MMAAVLLSFGAVQSAMASANDNSGILPASSRPFGMSYGEWSASLWQWLIETPWDVNPANPDAEYDVRTGQTGRVWFLSTALAHPHIEVPVGTALFIPMMNVECSSLEPEDSGFHGNTEAEQAECAKYWADHIINASCVIDGKPKQPYRVVSPQFSFTAPSPWIFGPTGGDGTAVGDGWYVMIAPLSVGEHIIEVKATLHFEAGELGPDPVDALQTDVTWHVNVVPGKP